VIAFGVACSTMVLPAFGRGPISPRWPFRIRQDQVDHPGGQGSRIVLQAHAAPAGYSGVSLPNSTRSRAFLRLRAVDRVQSDQRVELLPPLPVAGCADSTGDRVALAQAGLAHLRQRYVHVIGAGRYPLVRTNASCQDVEVPATGMSIVVLGDLRLAGSYPAGPRAPVRLRFAVAIATAPPAAPEGSSSSSLGAARAGVSGRAGCRAGGCPDGGRGGHRDRDAHPIGTLSADRTLSAIGTVQCDRVGQCAGGHSWRFRRSPTVALAAGGGTCFAAGGLGGLAARAGAGSRSWSARRRRPPTGLPGRDSVRRSAGSVGPAHVPAGDAGPVRSTPCRLIACPDASTSLALRMRPCRMRDGGIAASASTMPGNPSALRRRVDPPLSTRRVGRQRTGRRSRSGPRQFEGFTHVVCVLSRPLANTDAAGGAAQSELVPERRAVPEENCTASAWGTARPGALSR